MYSTCSRGVLWSYLLVQWKWIRLVTMKLRVRSLASLSGSVTWRCCELWCRSKTQLRSRIALAVAETGSCISNWTPSLGTSICCGWGPKKKKKGFFVFVVCILTTYVFIFEYHKLQSEYFKRYSACSSHIWQRTNISLLALCCEVLTEQPINIYLKSLSTGNNENLTALIWWRPTTMHTFM